MWGNDDITKEEKFQKSKEMHQHVDQLPRMLSLDRVTKRRNSGPIFELTRV